MRRRDTGRGYGTNGYISPEAWDWADNDITSEIDLAKRDSFAVGMTIINGLLGPYLEMDEVKVNFGEQQQHVLSRINTWKDRLRKKINRDRLQDEGLSDLADAAIGLIEENPDTRLTVQDALRLIWKNADIVKKKGMFEITKI